MAYEPIAPPNYIKLGLQHRLGIYVGYDSPSIIRHLELLTRDVFTIRFASCYFNESIWLLKMSQKKLIGMHHGYMHMILAPVSVNLKFKRSLNYIIL